MQQDPWRQLSVLCPAPHPLPATPASTTVPCDVCTARSRLLPTALVLADRMSVLLLPRPGSRLLSPHFCPHTPRVHSPRPARVELSAAPSWLLCSRGPASGGPAPLPGRPLPAGQGPRWLCNKPPPAISSGNSALAALKALRLPVTRGL